MRGGVLSDRSRVEVWGKLTGRKGSKREERLREKHLQSRRQKIVLRWLRRMKKKHIL